MDYRWSRVSLFVIFDLHFFILIFPPLHVPSRGLVEDFLDIPPPAPLPFSLPFRPARLQLSWDESLPPVGARLEPTLRILSAGVSLLPPILGEYFFDSVPPHILEKR